MKTFEGKFIIPSCKSSFSRRGQSACCFDRGNNHHEIAVETSTVDLFPELINRPLLISGFMDNVRSTFVLKKYECIEGNTTDSMIDNSMLALLDQGRGDEDKEDSNGKVHNSSKGSNTTICGILTRMSPRIVTGDALNPAVFLEITPDDQRSDHDRNKRRKCQCTYIVLYGRAVFLRAYLSIGRTYRFSALESCKFKNSFGESDYWFRLMLTDNIHTDEVLIRNENEEPDQNSQSDILNKDTVTISCMSRIATVGRHKTPSSAQYIDFNVDNTYQANHIHFCLATGFYVPRFNTIIAPADRWREVDIRSTVLSGDSISKGLVVLSAYSVEIQEHLCLFLNHLHPNQVDANIQNGCVVIGTSVLPVYLWDMLIGFTASVRSHIQFVMDPTMADSKSTTNSEGSSSSSSSSVPARTNKGRALPNTPSTVHSGKCSLYHAFRYLARSSLKHILRADFEEDDKEAVLDTLCDTVLVMSKPQFRGILANTNEKDAMELGNSHEDSNNSGQTGDIFDIPYPEYTINHQEFSNVYYSELYLLRALQDAQYLQSQLRQVWHTGMLMEVLLIRLRVARSLHEEKKKSSRQELSQLKNQYRYFTYMASENVYARLDQNRERIGNHTDSDIEVVVVGRVLTMSVVCLKKMRRVLIEDNTPSLPSFQYVETAEHGILLEIRQETESTSEHLEENKTSKTDESCFVFVHDVSSTLMQHFLHYKDWCSSAPMKRYAHTHVVTFPQEQGPMCFVRNPQMVIEETPLSDYYSGYGQAGSAKRNTRMRCFIHVHDETQLTLKDVSTLGGKTALGLDRDETALLEDIKAVSLNGHQLVSLLSGVQDPSSSGLLSGPGFSTQSKQNDVYKMNRPFNSVRHVLMSHHSSTEETTIPCITGIVVGKEMESSTNLKEKQSSGEDVVLSALKREHEKVVKEQKMLNEKRSRGPCFDFQKTGACWRGNTCIYSHGELDRLSLKEDAPEVPPNNLCFNFQKGKCSKGDACNYSHWQPKETMDLTNDLKDNKEVCFDFQKTGACWRGNTCKYSHGELDRLSLKEDAPEVPPNNLCFNFQKGKCSKGDACNYSHWQPKETMDLTNDLKDNKEVCFDFQKTGACWRGNTCKYSHGEVDDLLCKVIPRGVCFDFKKGICSRGDDCMYSHGAPPIKLPEEKKKKAASSTSNISDKVVSIVLRDELCEDTVKVYLPATLGKALVVGTLIQLHHCTLRISDGNTTSLLYKTRNHDSLRASSIEILDICHPTSASVWPYTIDLNNTQDVGSNHQRGETYTATCYKNGVFISNVREQNLNLRTAASMVDIPRSTVGNLIRTSSHNRCQWRLLGHILKLAAIKVYPSCSICNYVMSSVEFLSHKRRSSSVNNSTSYDNDYSKCKACGFYGGMHCEWAATMTFEDNTGECYLTVYGVETIFALLREDSSKRAVPGDITYNESGHMVHHMRERTSKLNVITTVNQYVRENGNFVYAPTGQVLGEGFSRGKNYDVEEGGEGFQHLQGEEILARAISSSKRDASSVKFENATLVLEEYLGGCDASSKFYVDVCPIYNKGGNRDNNSSISSAGVAPYHTKTIKVQKDNTVKPWTCSNSNLTTRRANELYVYVFGAMRLNGDDSRIEAYNALQQVAKNLNGCREC